MRLSKKKKKRLEDEKTTLITTIQELQSARSYAEEASRVTAKRLLESEAEKKRWDAERINLRDQMSRANQARAETRG